jgi:hypothetical protein
MANKSISDAFKRFWQHTVAALGNKADINHTHEMLPLSGGTISGDIDFGNNSHHLSWTTKDGTIIHLRPHTPTNVFQVTMQNPTTGVAEFGALSLHTDGHMEYGGYLTASKLQLVEGVSYGTEAQMNALQNPMKGQIFFVKV